MKKNLMLKGLALIAGVALLPQLYYEKRHRYVSKTEQPIKIIEMFNQEYYLESAGGFPLFVKVYPVKKPKAVIQIVHGAMEHQGRYQNLIDFLNDQGYTVIANDHRGHGRSTNEKYSQGVMNGADEIVDDLYLVTRFAKELFPGLSFIMFGHSMGSMLVRLYLKQYENQIDKVILTGVPPYNAKAPYGVAFARIVSFYHGNRKFSPLLNIFPDNLDWISKDKRFLETIQKDNLSMGKFTNVGNLTMFEMNKALKYPATFKTHKPNLPIILLVGEEDIIAGGLKGLKRSIDMLQEAGYINVYSKLYPEMRHEIIHDTNYQEVFEDIGSFIEKVN